MECSKNVVNVEADGYEESKATQQSSKKSNKAKF